MENNKDTTEHGENRNQKDTQSISKDLVFSSYNNQSVIVKKTDKLVTALYMVTDFMEDSEPMKMRLRTLAIRLLSTIRVFDKAPGNAQSASFEKADSFLEEILSLIDIASTVGVVSAMNGSILMKEFHALSEIIRTNHQLAGRSYFNPKPLSDFLLKDELFAESPRMPFSYSPTDRIPRPPVFDVKDPPSHEATATRSSQNSQGQNKAAEISHSDIVTTKLRSSGAKSDIALKIARRGDIINFIKDKKEVTIKDISSVIVGCSEKTIQRMLGVLVSEGVLKRTGDKRWSRYSLV